MKKFLEDEQRQRRLLDGILGPPSTVSRLLEEERKQRELRELIYGPVDRVAAVDRSIALQARSAAEEFDRLMRGTASSVLDAKMAAGVWDQDSIDFALRHVAGIEHHVSSLREIDRPLFDAANLAVQGYLDNFRQPSAAETLRLATGSLASVQAEALSKQIAEINAPWARVGNETASAIALGRLQELSRGVLDAPFAPATAGLLRDGLGDWRSVTFARPEEWMDPISRVDRYRALGLDDRLTDFPSATFDGALDRFGLVEENAGTDTEDEEDERAVGAFRLIRQLERHLRQFIIDTLTNEFGPKWLVQQVPGDIRAQWEERRQTDVDSDRTPRPHLIDYGDFTDYIKIIARKDNWDRAFKPIFRRKEDISESFNRLFPVRLVTAHSAIVTLDDEALLRFEASRILRAIGR